MDRIISERMTKATDQDSCVVVIGPDARRPMMFPYAQFDLWHWEEERNQRVRLLR